MGADRLRRVRRRLHSGDLLGHKLDEIVLAWAEIKPHAALNFSVVVAAHFESVAQGDEFARLRGWGQCAENCNRDEYLAAHCE
jgi:hypothetical protein